MIFAIVILLYSSNTVLHLIGQSSSSMLMCIFCFLLLQQSAERCVSTLLDLIQTKVNYVVQEAIVVIKVKHLILKLFYWHLSCIDELSVDLFYCLSVCLFAPWLSGSDRYWARKPGTGWKNYQASVIYLSEAGRAVTLTDKLMLSEMNWNLFNLKV